MEQWQIKRKGRQIKKTKPWKERFTAIHFTVRMIIIKNKWKRSDGKSYTPKT